MSGLAAMLVARVLLGLRRRRDVSHGHARHVRLDRRQAKRGFAQGITHSCARLGNALTPPLVAWLIAR